MVEVGLGLDRIEDFPINQYFARSWIVENASKMFPIWVVLNLKMNLVVVMMGDGNIIHCELYLGRGK